MIDLIVELQNITHHSISKEDAANRFIKLHPNSNKKDAEEIVFKAREYVIGNFNAVKLKEFLTKKGF